MQEIVQDWGIYARIVTALFVVANPIGVVPVFISLTDGQSMVERKRTTRITAVTVAIVLGSAVFLGDPLLALLESGLPHSGSVEGFSFS